MARRNSWSCYRCSLPPPILPSSASAGAHGFLQQLMNRDQGEIHQTTTAEGKITHENPLLINLQHELISFNVELERFSLLWASGTRLQRISSQNKPTHLLFFVQVVFLFFFHCKNGWPLLVLGYASIFSMLLILHPYIYLKFIGRNKYLSRSTKPQPQFILSNLAQSG